MWVAVEFENGEISFECKKTAICKTQDKWSIIFWGYNENPEHAIACDNEQDARLKYSILMAEVNVSLHIRTKGYYFNAK